MQNQKVAPFSSKYAPNQKVGCESFYRIELEAMWEKLYVFLHQLKRRFFVLSTNWNADLMSRGQADAEDDEETRGLIIWPAGLLLLHHLHGTASCHYAHQHCEASNTHGTPHHDTNVQPMCVLLRRSKNMSAVGIKQAC